MNLTELAGALALAGGLLLVSAALVGGWAFSALRRRRPLPHALGACTVAAANLAAAGFLLATAFRLWRLAVELGIL